MIFTLISPPPPPPPPPPNWRDIYEFDRKMNLPFVHHGRDFYVKENASPGQPGQKLLVRDLFHMARLRLRACDLKEVQVVVETDIDLGVFAGKYIGIDDIVQRLSAYTARKVLQGDGSIIS